MPATENPPRLSEQPLLADRSVPGDKPLTVKEPRVSYLSLPHKTQLAILYFSRVADPLAISSMNSYVYFQVRWLKHGASASEVAAYVGLLVGAKTAAKVATGLFWGRLSDASFGGRKLVLLIGMLSSCIGCIGYGFATSFGAAVFWQVFLAGMSSNVSMSRCIIADLNPDKRMRARALLILPVCAGVGMFFGPLLGGFLSARATSGILADYPYALPNLVIAAIYGISSIAILFVLRETLETHQNSGESFKALWMRLRNLITRSKDRDTYAYTAIGTTADMQLDNSSPTSPTNSTENPPTASKSLPFRKIWTPQVIATLLAQFIITGHMGTFTTLWVVFLSTPVSTHDDFSGGLGLAASSVGFLMSIIGGSGVALQLFLYPWLNDRFSTVRIWRATLLVFPLMYLLAPFTALVAAHFASHDSSTTEGSNKNSGAALYERAPAVIASLVCILLLQMTGRLGVTPATTLLINECVPAQSARGTINSAGNVVANLSKCIFPPLVMLVYSWGLNHGVVGVGFWILSGLAVLAVVASYYVIDGHDADTKGKRDIGRVETV